MVYGALMIVGDLEDEERRNVSGVRIEQFPEQRHGRVFLGSKTFCTA
jgi:hypothetical protein